MRGHAKVDSNHAAIVAALRLQGWFVLSLAAIGDGCPDILLHHPASQQWRLVEIKNAQGRNRLTAAQVKFAKQGWPVEIVRNIDEALSL